MGKKVVIVGGVAGGATTAARLRRLDEAADIIMFERGEYVSYANCGLPYYIGGIINERGKLFVQTPESFTTRFNIKIKVQHEVIRIDRAAKQVEVRDVRTQATFFEKYDKLVLSPGAEPIKPPITGINDSSIFTLRTVSDTDAIYNHIVKTHPTHAVIVGAGFIGLEMAENLAHQGIKITIVELLEQVMAPLDFEMASEVHQHLKTKNVELYLKDGVSAFSRENGKLSVRLASNKIISTDMVILSIGIKPESGLAKDAGLDLGERGAIVVDEYMRTSDHNIYAVGDAVEFMHPILGKRVSTYLAGPANKQGRIVADNIAFGNTRKYAGAIGTAIAKVFDVTAGVTGVAAKTLKKAGIPFKESIIHVGSHAGYFPGALPMTLKLVFAPDTGKLYGAQAVGYEGVDKRIDAIAMVLKHGGCVSDLTEFEHAYAPPYSSAKDPVNIAGFAAENIIQGIVKTVQWYDVKEMAGKPDILLLDVRTQEEFALGTIEGSVNIPIDSLRKRLQEVPRNKKIIVFCGVGLRAYLACRILYQNNIDEAYNLSGGYKTWEHVTAKQGNEDIFQGDFMTKDDDIHQAAPKNETYPEGSRIVDADACGLQCPGPIIRLKQEVDKIRFGESVRLVASDPGFARDAASWCTLTGHRLVSLKEEAGTITALVQKVETSRKPSISPGNRNKTLIVFSDDMDKALASFVIANGALSTGGRVTMFFTFWGLNVIKRKNKPSVKKDLMGRMFSLMMPGNSRALNLSKINMFGLGRIMMKLRMKMKRVDSLESMIDSAIKAGAELVACQMSMDIMGVAAEELIDGVKIGGVATYLQAAEEANLNLFI